MILKPRNIYSSLHSPPKKKTASFSSVKLKRFSNRLLEFGGTTSKLISTQRSSSGADDIRSELRQRHAMPGYPLIHWITFEKDKSKHQCRRDRNHHCICMVYRLMFGVVVHINYMLHLLYHDICNMYINICVYAFYLYICVLYIYINICMYLLNT